MPTCAESISIGEARVAIFPDTKQADQFLAETFVELSRKAITERGTFFIALSGGGTPKPLYQLLGSAEWRKRIDWQHTHVFLGDERFVPLSNPASNFRMIDQALLSHLEIPKENIHPVATESGDPEAAAADYERQIKRAFGNQAPRFDVNLLGIGTNAHTASLFPHTKALHERDRLVVPNYVEELSMWRITFTVPLINASRHILMQAYGEEKANPVYRVLLGPRDPDDAPAQFIHAEGDGNFTWVIDQAAAQRLPRK
ncbi:MAG TPA: 6-phosphogluconolactonase [Terriglobales bacterium]